MGAGTTVSTGDAITAAKMNLKLEDVDQADLGTINNIQFTPDTNPAGTVLYISADNTNDITINAKATGNVLVAIAGTDEYTLTADALILASGNKLKFAGDDGILDSNGNELLEFAATGSALNGLKIVNGATGNAPKIGSNGTGAEANIGLILLDSNGNELLIMASVASAVNEVTITNAATGERPKIDASGEANIGLTLRDSNDNELLDLIATASAVNEIGIVNTATGDKPVVRAQGEGDLGMILANYDGSNTEEILILAAVATAVNEITITSAAAGDAPSVAATGDDTDINLLLGPKGAGGVDINGVELILDADGDTSITADTDDQIDVRISGADDFAFKANSFELLAGSEINVETATNEHAVFISRNTLAYTDTTNKTLFVLPANAVILDVILHVTTVFNDSGTDVIDVGTTAGDPDEYVDALDASSASVNRCGDNSDMPATARGSVGGSAVTVLGKYTGQNANADAGAATIEILWTIA